MVAIDGERSAVDWACSSSPLPHARRGRRAAGVPENGATEGGMDSIRQSRYNKNRKESLMKKPRRNHSASFKARVAMDALRGVKTVAEIAAENNLHPTQVTSWKTDLLKGARLLFERKNAPDHERQILETNCERLERKVGQLVIEKEFLEKKCVQLGIDP